MGKIKSLRYMASYKKSDLLQFHHARITKGNPVEGILISEDEEWITIKLTKNIEGMVTVWDKGTNYTARKSLITKLKKINK